MGDLGHEDLADLLDPVEIGGGEPTMAREAGDGTGLEGLPSRRVGRVGIQEIAA
jgi:hypothetical protein